MLWENINESLVFNHLSVSNSDEVFDALGGNLEKLGYCKNTYVQALKDRERSFPTGIQLPEIGIAIPHTDPEHVNKSAISIATLENPVRYFHMGTSPGDGAEVQVKLIIMLAIAGTGHLDILQKAIQLIQDQEAVSCILEAKTARDVINIIQAKEESENENN
ncbi:MAG: PTS sugar transporter subunit IIA [Eubacteriales bacterium]|nr:PTS sugar transporter subunit IIA [Eubacteriales bacterium]